MDGTVRAVLSLRFVALRFLMPLLLVPLLLGAAAAPPDDCTAGADSGPVMPMPLDLTGRPSELTGPIFAPQQAAGAGTGCPGPLPSTPLPTTLRSDVLHGLPTPDSLRPIDEPKRAPDFQ